MVEPQANDQVNGDTPNDVKEISEELKQQAEATKNEANQFFKSKIFF